MRRPPSCSRKVQHGPHDIAALNFEPIAVLLSAWLLLGQSLTPLQIVGAIIVVGAIVALGTGKR